MRENKAVRGEKHYATSLTAEKVVEIRAKLCAGVLQSELAKEYGLSQVAISDIKRRVTWA